MSLNIHVWSENKFDKPEPLRVPDQVFESWREKAKQIYPEGIHETVGRIFDESGKNVTTGTLSDPDDGLSPPAIERADTLVLYSNYRNDEVGEATVSRVTRAVKDGMGLVVLHSGRKSKIFRSLMGTSCELNTNNDSTAGRLVIAQPNHPIVKGIDTDFIEFEKLQANTEPFRIPTPEELVTLNWTNDGGCYRSGCCYHRDAGRIFYFGPGHETCPIYHDEHVKRLLDNAVTWVSS